MTFEQQPNTPAPRMKSPDAARPPVASLRTDNHLRRLLLTLQDGHELEVVHAPPDVLVVPTTEEGSVILTRGWSHALGKPIWAAPSALHVDSSSDVAATANEIYDSVVGQSASAPALERVGTFNPWKYLNSEAHAFRFDLSRHVSANILKRKGYSLFSAQQYDELVASGALTDLRTIVAVEMARAFEYTSAPDPALLNRLFTDYPKLNKLRQRPPLSRKCGPRFIEHSQDERDYFPRRTDEWGVQIIDNVSHQKQVIAISGEGDGAEIVFLIEPFFAQGTNGTYVLTLPAGSVPRDTLDDQEVVIGEARQETGTTITDVRPVTQPCHPSPLGLTVVSTVCEARVVKFGRRKGYDESPSERGFRVVIPVRQVRLLMRAGLITDASVIAGLSQWCRQHGVPMW